MRPGGRQAHAAARVLTDTLCTRCGLCCDGTLLGDAELAGPAEATRLEILGVDVDTDDAGNELLPLPCAALRGTRCSIYAQRPQCCRTFECRLLRNARRGAVTVDGALARIAQARAQVRHVNALLARIERRQRAHLPLAERCADAISTASCASRPDRRAIATLGDAMAAVNHTMRTTFLD